MRFRYAILLTLLLCGIAVGCGSNSSDSRVDCRQLVENDKPDPSDFDEVQVDNALQWIKNRYGGTGIESYETQIGTVFAWGAGKQKYIAEFKKNEMLRITVQKGGTGLIGNELINCLGVPELYNASYTEATEAPIFYLELWYPRQGVFVSTHCIKTNPFTPCPPTISGSLEWKDVIFVRPDTLDRVIESVVPYARKETRDEILGSLKPWPGSWEAISIRIIAP